MESVKSIQKAIDMKAKKAEPSEKDIVVEMGRLSENIEHLVEVKQNLYNRLELILGPEPDQEVAPPSIPRNDSGLGTRLGEMRQAVYNISASLEEIIQRLCL